MLLSNYLWNWPVFVQSLSLYDLNFQLYLHPKTFGFSFLPKKLISEKMGHVALDHCSLQFIFKSLFHGSEMSVAIYTLKPIPRIRWCTINLPLSTREWSSTEVSTGPGRQRIITKKILLFLKTQRLWIYFWLSLKKYGKSVDLLINRMGAWTDDWI